MPIRKEEWEKGRKADTVEWVVEDFLRKNRQSAYTVAEICANLYNTRFDSFADIVRSIISSNAVNEALKKLVAEKTVKARVIQGLTGQDTYYTFAG